LQLEVENKGSTAMKTTQALHSYYRVSDISKATISGLSGVEYYDNADGRKKKDGSPGDVAIGGETDRLYSGAGAAAQGPT
jgi:glucose-6-phosphate 1-epimerase